MWRRALVAFALGCGWLANLHAGQPPGRTSQQSRMGGSSTFQRATFGEQQVQPRSFTSKKATVPTTKFDAKKSPGTIGFKSAPLTLPPAKPKFDPKLGSTPLRTPGPSKLSDIDAKLKTPIGGLKSPIATKTIVPRPDQLVGKGKFTILPYPLPNHKPICPPHLGHCPRPFPPLCQPYFPTATIYCPVVSFRRSWWIPRGGERWSRPSSWTAPRRW